MNPLRCEYALSLHTSASKQDDTRGLNNNKSKEGHRLRVSFSFYDSAILFVHKTYGVCYPRLLVNAIAKQN